jgi:putative hemolysin
MTFGSFLADHAGRLGAMVGLLLASGFFSGSETAFFSLSPGQMHSLRQGGRGRWLARLVARPQSTLNLLLLSNMMVNVTFAAISAVIVFDIRQANGATSAAAMSIGALLALILFGEVTPKMLAVTITERWAVFASRPIWLFGHLLSPILWVLDALFVTPLTRLLSPAAPGPRMITTDELQALLDLSAKRGLLDDEAHDLLQEIVELSELRVADVMVPRVDMTSWDLAEPRQHLLHLIREKRLRRVPVYDDSVDNILGLIHAKRALLSPRAPLRELIVPIPFVPVAASIERVLLRFRQTGRQVAIAVDEYGGTAGLIALEDILDEIVGDMPRDDDRQTGPAVVPVSEREYLLEGALAIHEWADAFDIDLQGGRISTVGGLVMALLDRLPAVGDTVRYRNLQFTVEAMRGRRIAKLRLTLLEDA